MTPATQHPATKTQRQRIVEILEREGEITRNRCLSMFISRLSARIADLEEDGWVFETEQRHGDYVYKVISQPQAETLAMSI